jgi:hypothetical protein
MTGPNFKPVPDEGDQIKHRVVARLDEAHMDVVAACTATGCRVEALLGEGELTFEEAVGLANLLGCSPAVFFDQIQGT